MRTGIVGAYVYALHTAALIPLVFILFYIQAAPAQVPDQFPVNTAPVTDPVLLQIRFLRAGHDLHTMIFCSMSQLFGKFTQAFVLKSFTAQLFQVLFYLWIIVQKTDDHLLCVPLQFFRDPGKGLQMVLRGITGIEENRVIAPYGPLCSYGP